MKPMIADMTNDDRRWQAVCERDTATPAPTGSLSSPC